MDWILWYCDNNYTAFRVLNYWSPFQPLVVIVLHWKILQHSNTLDVVAIRQNEPPGLKCMFKGSD